MATRESSPIPDRNLLWWVVRGLWAFLAVIHLWPLVAIGSRLVGAPSIADAFWLISLVGVIGLFGLKAIDHRWLRIQRPGVECTVFLVAAAMIHGDVVSRGSLPALVVESSAVVAVAGVAAANDRRVRRRVADWLGRFKSRCGLLGCDSRCLGTLSHVLWLGPRPVLARAVLARGPPSLIR